MQIGRGRGVRRHVQKYIIEKASTSAAVAEPPPEVGASANRGAGSPSASSIVILDGCDKDDASEANEAAWMLPRRVRATKERVAQV
jgi:hypothetical protein